MQGGHLLVDDLREVDDRLPLAALVARHQGIDSTPDSGTSRPSVEGQHPVGPAGQQAVVRHDHQRRLELARQAGEELVQPLAVVRGRGCRRARRPGRPAGRRPAPAPPPRAAARRPRAAPGRCVIRPASPTAASSSSARERASVLGLPGDQQRHHHVLQRAELPQQVVELEDEPDLPVPHRRERGRRSARRRPARRAGPGPPSAYPARRAGGAACSSPRRSRRRWPRTRPRATARSTPDSTSIGLPSPAAVDLAEPLRLEDRAHSWRIASTGVSRRGRAGGIDRGQHRDGEAGERRPPATSDALDVHRQVVDEVDGRVDPDPARLVHHVRHRQPDREADRRAHERR